MTNYKHIACLLLLFFACFLPAGKAQPRVLLRTSLTEYYQAALEIQGNRWALSAAYRFSAPQNPGGFFVMPSVELKRFRKTRALVFRRFSGIYARYKGMDENRNYRYLSRSDVGVGVLYGVSARVGRWYTEVFGGAGLYVVRNHSASPLDLRLNLSVGRILFEKKKKKLLPI
jgi:hypothetical protein